MTTELNTAIATGIQLPALGEAIQLLITLFPANPSFISLGGQWADLEDNYHSGGVTEEKYRIDKIRFRESILFFIKKLNIESQKKILAALERGNPSGNGRSQAMTIAFVESTPQGVPALQIGFEYKQMEEALRTGRFNSSYRLLPIVFSVTLTDLITILLQDTPDLLHFSGHAGKNGLVLSDENNDYTVVSNESIDLVFRTVQPAYIGAGRKLELVFLSACNSEAQVSSVSQWCNYSIAVNDYIPDKEARAFAILFYQFLSTREQMDIETCFKAALTVFRNSFRQSTTFPQLWKKGVKVDVSI